MPLLSLSVTQLLLAFVSASILHKLVLNRFFLHYLAAKGFTYYKPPSDSALSQLKYRQHISKVNNPGGKLLGKSRGKQKRNNEDNRHAPKSTFKIQASDLEYLQLEEAQMNILDFESASYALDLEWLVDLSLLSGFCFFLTEIQFYFYPNSNETNFSILWALLVVGYSIKILWNLTSIYFKNEQSVGERSICLISGSIFLLIAMIVLITKESYLEFGLDDAYRSFNQSATAFVNSHAINQSDSRTSGRPISYILIKLIIAVICALTGTLFTFPGFRYGQLHQFSIDSGEASTICKAIFGLNYLSPLFIIALWIKPLARDIVVSQTLTPIDDATFNTIRIYCVLATTVGRFYLLPQVVGAFLMSSRNRLARIKFRGGTTTNKEVQITIKSMYNYANIVVIQYILPILISFFVAIMLKFLGNISWIPSTMGSTLTQNLSSNNQSIPLDNFSSMQSHNDSSRSSIQKLLGLVSTVNLIEFKNIFSEKVFQGIFGFATWWLHFTWFSTTTMGLIYHSYFSR